jgi:hypothetical protein
MPDDVEKLKQKLVKAEVARQKERFHSLGSEALDALISARNPQWNDTENRVEVSTRFGSRVSLGEFLEELRQDEPYLFQTESVGSEDTPRQPLRTISSRDQKAIDANLEGIARGRVVVIDANAKPPAPLKPNEVWDSDLPTLMQSGKVTLQDIARGKVIIRSADNLDDPSRFTVG